MKEKFFTLSRQACDEFLATARRARISRSILFPFFSNFTKQRKLNNKNRRIRNKYIAQLGPAVEFGSLSKGVIHDIMSPLQAIALTIERLEGNSQEKIDEIREVIDTAQSSARQLGSYIISVKKGLDFEAVGREMTTSLKSATTTCFNLVTYNARMNNTLLRDLTTDHLFSIHPSLLHQILLNLINNAVDACGPCVGQKMVSIYSKTESRHICLSVEDTGVGFPYFKRRLIGEEPFTTKKNGTGVGLITVKCIADKLGISIHYKPRSNGTGSIFEIRIPIRYLVV